MKRKLEPEDRNEPRFRIAVVTTGGTIAKTYDPDRAALLNCRQVVAEIVQSLRLEGAEVSYIDLMHKDSLEIDDDDRELIVSTVEEAARGYDAVIVTHGTDTLAATADALWANDPHPSVPVILTGAMVPYVVRGSDGGQNMTESLFAARVLAPGTYVVMHNRALSVPGVVKDRDSQTFMHERRVAGS